MPYNQFFCAHCGAEIKYNATVCPKCKLQLSLNDIKVKQISGLEAAEAEVAEYGFGARLEDLTNEQISQFKKHNITSKFPLWLSVVLHFVTLGIFSVIYYGIKHGQLPRISNKDLHHYVFIILMFVPVLNIFWAVYFWTTLVARINFQYRLRGRDQPISPALPLAVQIIAFIAGLNIVYILILKPYLVVQVQKAINGLVDLER